jgi:hypothetical protein
MMSSANVFGRITFLLLAVATLAGIAAFTAPASGHADEGDAPIFVNRIPPGYRDWKLVSIAHEEGNLNDIRAILGNDTAIKAYREEKLPFPEGTQALPESHGVTSPRRRITKFLAIPNLSFQGPPRIGTCSLW